MDYDLILKNISRHINLDEDEVDFFISLLQSAKINKKKFLLRPGEVCRHENFVIKGCMRSYTIDNNGFEHNEYFAVEDWWTGDMHSFLTQTPSVIFNEALEDSEVLQISKPNLETLLEKIPKFERFFRILYQRSLVATLGRVREINSHTAEERYIDFMKKFPKLEQRIPQKHIATYLGITPEFLSTLRRKLANR